MLLQVEGARVLKQFPRLRCELRGQAPGFCTNKAEFELFNVRQMASLRDGWRYETPFNVTVKSVFIRLLLRKRSFL